MRALRARAGGLRRPRPGRGDAADRRSTAGGDASLLVLTKVPGGARIVDVGNGARAGPTVPVDRGLVVAVPPRRVVSAPL